jgi:hypothetical protein
MVRQPHVRDGSGNPISIAIPSLYGVVSSLVDPRIVSALTERGVPLEND